MRKVWLRCLVGILTIATQGCCEPGVDDSQISAYASPVPIDEGVFAAWLGTAGVFVSDGVDSLLIDPFVSRAGVLHVTMGRKLDSDPELVQKWTRNLQIPRRTPVLVSHSHFDHLLDAPRFVKDLEGRLYGSGSTQVIGHAEGLGDGQGETIQAGDVLELGAFRVRVLPSCHAPAAFGMQIYPGDIVEPVQLPAGASTYKAGSNFSFVIEHAKGKILHHASPCVVAGMFEGIDADLVLLGITGRTSTARVLSDVVDAVGARAVVPIHYDNFFAALDQPMSTLPTAYFAEFMDTTRKTRDDLKLDVLTIGKTTKLLPLTKRAASN